MNDPRLTTLLIACPEEVGSAVRARMGPQVQVRDASEEEVRAGGWDADVVVVGEHATDPIALAQAAWRHHRGVTVLISSSPDDHGRVADRLRYAPYVGRSTRCLATVDPAALAREVAQRLEVARTYREYDRHATGVAAQIARLDDLSPELGETLQRLHDRERFLAALVDSSSDAIFSKDLDGRIRSWNQAAVRLYGYRPEEAVGHPVAMLAPPDRQEELSEIQQAVRAGRRIEGLETERLRKDGTVVDVSLTVCPVRDDGGRVLAASVITRDIGEAKRRERALRRSNEELEQFAYVASHDLQEPLRMVASFSELLARRCGEQLDDRGREYLGFLVEGAQRMRQLVNDLLAYSRLESEGAPPTRVEPRAALDMVLADLRPALEEARAEVVTGTLPAVLVDPGQLRRIFQNLVGNALKFRGPAPAHVEVTAQAEGREVVFCVRDRGIGIEPRHRDLVFRMFQRLHPRGEYAGSGIGLAVVKRIVERHDGRAWIGPGPGQGTRVYFSLPRAPDEREDA
jgi:hypothetical protein